MNIRQVQDTDLVDIGKWFASRKWPFPAKERVAPEWVFVSEDESGELLACIGVYLTGRSRAYLEMPSTNPEFSDEKVMPAFDALVKKVIEFLNHGVSPSVNVLSFYTTSDALADRFKSLGFKKEPNYFKLTWTRKNTKDS